MLLIIIKKLMNNLKIRCKAIYNIMEILILGVCFIIGGITGIRI